MKGKIIQVLNYRDAPQFLGSLRTTNPMRSGSAANRAIRDGAIAVRISPNRDDAIAVRISPCRDGAIADICDDAIAVRISAIRDGEIALKRDGHWATQWPYPAKYNSIQHLAFTLQEETRMRPC